MALKWKPGKKGNRVSYSYSTLILLGFYMALKCKPHEREPCILSVFHLQSRGLVSAATFRAGVLDSELLLTGFFWSSFLGVELTRFFFPRAFRLWIPKRCKGVHCADLGESFLIPTSIYLQNLASIQPRTSLVKTFASPRTDRRGALTLRVTRI